MKQQALIKEIQGLLRFSYPVPAFLLKNTGNWNHNNQMRWNMFRRAITKI